MLVLNIIKKTTEIEIYLALKKLVDDITLFVKSHIYRTFLIFFTNDFTKES